MAQGLRTAHRWDLAWEDDVDILSLRGGVQVKVLHRHPESGLTDLLIKLPPGYVEPKHVHRGTHSVLVLEGLQVAEGEPMRPGDYVFGEGGVMHGPFEYPEGCVVFASFHGDPHHLYAGSPAGEPDI
ncbi:MAG: cupin domain-containing protein [Candidatus Dormibacterales bacterium]